MSSRWFGRPNWSRLLSNIQESRFCPISVAQSQLFDLIILQKSSCWYFNSKRFCLNPNWEILLVKIFESSDNYKSEKNQEWKNYINKKTPLFATHFWGNLTSCFWKIAIIVVVKFLLSVKPSCLKIKRSKVEKDLLQKKSF